MPENSVWLDADYSRLSQIFSNLLNNAAKYTDHSGIIEIGAKEADDFVTVYVRDNGIGIPENMLQSIFRIFSQVDNSLERRHGGLGIGLTLAKNLVEMHGGTINVTSSGTNAGSEFTVTLPMLTAHDDFLEDESAQETPKPDRILKVLVVDDSEAAAKTLGWMIEELLGHETRIAHDGVSAIALARNYRPEIVLLDIGIPGMNGYEICKAMKADPLFGNTIFIAQTGWGQDEHKKRSREAGFHYHLVKPVNINDLQEIVSNYNKGSAIKAA